MKGKCSGQHGTPVRLGTNFIVGRIELRQAASSMVHRSGPPLQLQAIRPRAINSAQQLLRSDAAQFYSLASGLYPVLREMFV